MLAGAKCPGELRCAGKGSSPGPVDTADYLLDWQLAGRSAAGPVHWPLWPAPLPPLVGACASASAVATVLSASRIPRDRAASRVFTD